MRVIRLPQIALLGALLSAAAPAADPPPMADPAGFAGEVRGFLTEHCIKCHGPDKQKGKLRLDTLPPDFKDPRVVEKWKEVVTSVSNHEMPPEEEIQPSPEKSAAMAAWLEAQLAHAELAGRSTRVVLRRMNRAEYNNTIRDLVGVDSGPADVFPEDPPAGGFDNIGQALTMSPMQVELYYAAARQVLDRALVEGDQPNAVKWHFEPEENTKSSDQYRVKQGGNNIILNDGENRTEGGFTVVHHDGWNKSVGFRAFKVPHAGWYVIRFRAAGRVPSREAVVASAREHLEKRRQGEMAKNANGKTWHDEAYEQGMAHFATHAAYQYGPPRVKLTQHLGGAPRVIAEMDINAEEGTPGIYEVRAWFSTEDAGIAFNYAYGIPRLLENAWMQEKDDFARPELLLDWIELEGPVHASWPPPAHRKVMGDNDIPQEGETARARNILARFMPRAYRRPVTQDEVSGRLALFAKVRPDKASFVEAIKVPLAAVLASPHFLYLIEPDAPQDRPRALNDYELASRLSYFLWSSMPDETLSTLAAAGELSKPEVLRGQVNRLLADPRSGALATNFAGQWLGLRKVGTNPPSQTLYPEYDRHLELSIVRETEGFFSEVLRHDLDVRHLIKSDFVTINERLARFYGIPGVKGDTIRRVAVPPGIPRGGLVTQASIHSITSNGTRTSPVVRGTWILKTLLASDPGLPVANVGEIQSSVPGIDKATVRQRLAIHRETASCARCHDKIDPLGLAMENFDAAGQWRDREGHGYNGRIEKNDPLIDASATMPDGTAFTGVAGLQEQLLKKEDLFLNALASQLATYALGRELGFSDRAAVRGFVSQMQQDKNCLRALIIAIVTSESFTTK